MIQTETYRDPIDKEGWVVLVEGLPTTPRFNSKGAADVYADQIKSGYRRPEFSPAMQKEWNRLQIERNTP